MRLLIIILIIAPLISFSQGEVLMATNMRYVNDKHEEHHTELKIVDDDVIQIDADFYVVGKKSKLYRGKYLFITMKQTRRPRIYLILMDSSQKAIYVTKYKSKKTIKFTEMITDSNTVREAKDFLHENMDSGCQCPACGQNVRLYKRPLNSGCARFLIALYRLQMHESAGVLSKDVHDYIRGFSYFSNDEIRRHAQLDSKGLDYGIIRHWGLAEQAPNDDPKKRTSGQWKLTAQGYFFVVRQLRVPKRAHLYNNSLIAFGPETIDILEALGEDFNYNELMQ